MQVQVEQLRASSARWRRRAFEIAHDPDLKRRLVEHAAFLAWLAENLERREADNVEPRLLK